MLETRKTVTDPKLIEMLEHEIAEAHFGEEMMEEYDQASLTHTMTNPETGEQRQVTTEQEHLELKAQGWS
jgi:hypothetical protein